MFVKIFGNLLDSSIWAESNETRIVWITLLVMSDEDGVVRSTAPGIAHRARVSIGNARKALEVLESPDPDSRTPDNDGRRIERVPDGYLILNYEMFRQIHNRAERREQTRKRVRKHRKRKKATKAGDACNAEGAKNRPDMKGAEACNACNADVTPAIEQTQSAQGLKHASCNAPVTPCNECNDIEKETQTQLTTCASHSAQHAGKPKRTASTKAGTGPNVLKWWLGAGKAAGQKVTVTGKLRGQCREFGRMILDGQLSEEEAKGCMSAFFAEDDRQVVNSGHNFGFFLARLDKYRNQYAQADREWEAATNRLIESGELERIECEAQRIEATQETATV